MRKLKLIISIVFATFFSFTLKVDANTINSIDMDIYINSSGDAIITEVWKAYLNQGTEGYKPYYNLGNSTITDFSVSDENNNQFTYISNWNVDASFDEKVYKNGIVQKSDGVELCWGISNYGSKTYTLKYTINNFIYETSDDYQMLYWNLIPHDLSSKPGSVNIKIHADEKFEDTLDVWGYGNYGGTAYVYDGIIEMSSDGELDSDEYMTLLVKFSKDTFNITDNSLDEDFEYYYDMAEDGAEHFEDKQSFFGIIFSIIIILISFIPYLIIVIVVIHFSKYPKLGSRRFSFGKEGKKLTKKYQYYRDLPCNKDIYRAYWVSLNYGLTKKKTDLLGAVLLKWTKDGVVTISKKASGTILKKENTSIIFNNREKLTNELDKKLYDMMYEASKDGTLETKEFETWCNKNYSKILKWFDNIIDFETDVLISENKCIKVKSVYEIDPSMKEEAEQLDGLKRFLKDFSSLAKSNPIEVHMWEEYLMFAQIFGIAEQVAKDFKKIYPDEITDLSINQAIFINNISYRGMTKAISARDRARSYSSGGGGFSSGGGGGGSFGGGGGGGGFR